MGIIRTEEVAFHATDAEIDAAAPSNLVASIPAHRVAWLMRAGLDDDGVPVFLGEEKVDLYCVPRSIGEHSWLRLEVQPHGQGRGAKLSEKDELLVARYPWGEGCLRTRFRGGCNRSLDERLAPFLDLDLKAMMAAIDGPNSIAKHDPWLTRSDALRAGVSSESMAFDLESRHLRRLRYVLGVCAGVDQLITKLARSEAVGRLKELARRGKLEGPGRRRLGRLQDPQVIEELMDLAILSSLAGPVSDEDCRRLTGKPIHYLTEDIFVALVEDEVKLARTRASAQTKALASLAPSLARAEVV